MAKFISAAPLKNSNPDELTVFKHLEQLGDDWLVVWGYFFTDSYGETREGDFLVLSPQGGLMVIEVKGRSKLYLGPDGKWTGRTEDNPFSQLSRQWDSLKTPD